MFLALSSLLRPRLYTFEPSTLFVVIFAARAFLSWPLIYATCPHLLLKQAEKAKQIERLEDNFAELKTTSLESVELPSLESTVAKKTGGGGGSDGVSVTTDACWFTAFGSHDLSAWLANSRAYMLVNCFVPGTVATDCVIE